jgi:hypothetical protein
VAAGYVELSLSYSTMSSTSCNLSSNMVAFSTRSFTFSVSSVGISAGLGLVIRWHVVSFAFAFFSAVCSLSPSSYTVSSSVDIFPSIFLLMVICSSISSMSWVISASISDCFFIMASILSDYSSLTNTASSPIFPTLSSSWFPAYCTYLIEASAPSYQDLFSFWDPSRLATNDACDLRFSVACSRKRCTSCIWVLTMV